MAKVIILVGVAGSGKTTWAKEHIGENTVHLSSDALRIEMFGFEDQTRNHLVFREMNKRTVEALTKTKDVIYDATNLNRKKRRHLINQIARGYEVECVLFYLSLDRLLYRNEARKERTLPNLRILDMIKRFQVPLLSEGYTKITYVGEKSNTVRYSGNDVHILSQYKNYMTYNQKTPYHKLTLGKHIEKVMHNVNATDLDVKTKKLLETAASLHDLGKPLAREYDSEEDRAKYIGHENVSSYLTLPFVQPDTKDGDVIHTVVAYHMRAHNIKTEKSKKKMINEIGKEKYDLVMKFAECDAGAKE